LRDRQVRCQQRRVFPKQACACEASCYFQMPTGGVSSSFLAACTLELRGKSPHRPWTLSISIDETEQSIEGANDGVRCINSLAPRPVPSCLPFTEERRSVIGAAAELVRSW